MNLLEEYILRKGEIIILISGLSGSKRSLLAKEIERDFKDIKLISLEDYCRDGDMNKVEIIEVFGQKVRDWDNINIYDWDKFNDDISKYKNRGVVVYGDAFPKDKLKFETIFHMHITIGKEKLIEKRREFIEKNPEKCKDMIFFLDKLGGFINKITYAHYINNRKNSIINLWLNSDDENIDSMYDKVFYYIIGEMRSYLNEYYSKHERKFNFIKSENKIKSDISKKKSISISNSSSNYDSSSDYSSNYDSSSDYSSSSNYSSSENSKYDELERVFRNENRNNISLGAYNDLLLEANYVN
jgi:hypothetical protein